MNFIKVEDKLPDTINQKHRHLSSNTVSVFTKDGKFNAKLCRFSDGGTAWFESGTYRKLNVTHWMPLEQKENANP